MIRRPPRSTLFPYTTLFRSLAFPRESNFLEGRCRRANLVRVILGGSEEHTSELQSQSKLVCRLLLEKKKLDVTSSTSSLSNDMLYQTRTICSTFLRSSSHLL